MLACSQLAGANETLPDSELPSGLELYQRYLEHNGGRYNIEALTTIIASGTIVGNSNKTSDFRIYRKRPNKFRMSIERDGRTIETIFNGKQAWRRYSSANGGSRSVELESNEVAALASESSFEGPFLQAGGRSERIRPVAFEAVRGHPAIRVEIQPDANIPYDTIWLSVEHYQEVKMARKIPVEEQPERDALEETYFSDFTRVNGVHIARRIEYLIDGAPHRTVSIDSIQANAGIFDSFFELDSEPSNK